MVVLKQGKEIDQEVQLSREEILLQLRNEQERVFSLEKELEAAKKSLSESEETAERLKSCAKFDRLAREGQLKKSRIIEHELKGVRQDNALQARLREKAEEQGKSVDKALQRERAYRLRDMHERQQIHKLRLMAERNAKETFAKFVNEAKISSNFSSQVRGLRSAVQSQAMMMNETEKDFICNEQEIEGLRLDNERLRTELEEARKEASHHMKVREVLEKECQRIHTDMLRMSHESRKPIKSKMTRAHRIPLLTVEKAMGRSASKAMATKNIESTLDEGLTLEKLAKYVGQCRDDLNANAGSNGMVLTQVSGQDVASCSNNSEQPRISHEKRISRSTLHAPGSMYLGRGLGLKKLEANHQQL